MRFTKDKARQDPHYAEIFEACDNLLRNVHHFGFEDVVRMTNLEAWAAHIRWDWIKEWLQFELLVLEDVETEEDEDGHLFKKVYKRISDPSEDQTVTRALDPLAQSFFALKRKEKRRADREDERSGTAVAASVALERIQRAIAAQDLDEDSSKRGVAQYYATGYGKKTRGFADREFAGHSFADYGKNRAWNHAKAQLQRHDDRSNENERLLPAVEPLRKLATGDAS